MHQAKSTSSVLPPGPSGFGAAALSLPARARSLFAVLAALATAGGAGAQAPPPPVAPPAALSADRAAGASTVLTEHCEAWLGTLASPEFEGRGTGQEGFRKAADYVRAHFEQLRLVPKGDAGTYLQAVPWLSTQADPAKTFVEFTAGDGRVLRIPSERLAGQVSQNSTASGPAVLVVLAAEAAAGGQAEAAATVAAALGDVDPAGKVVLVHIKPGPAERDPTLASFRVVAELRNKDAAAVLTVETAPVSGGLIARSRPGRGGANRAVRSGRVPLVALRMGGADLAAVLAAGHTEGALARVGTTELSLQAKVQVEVAEQQAPAWNVVGVLPGSDPVLKDEYVVIGSHLDHLGKRGTTYYPGADDDGSGTTGVLAVSTMFAKNPTRPKRSILFVCFCGEEAGLVGSSFFADHCPVELSSIVGELQMDMIGRDEESDSESAKDNLNSLHLVGTEKLSHDLHELCLAKNETAGFELEWDEEDVFFRSDHANFAKKGIPIAFFFTGFHRDYHKPSDTPDKINYPKLLRVATYVYDIGFELGTMSGRPLVDPELWEQNRARLRGTATPAAPLRGQK